MSKMSSIIVTLALIIGIGIIFIGSNIGDNGTGNGQNVEIKDGVQYITINARGGYSPRVSEAEAGIPTKLIIKTDGTYDCSSSLVIPAIGFQEILSQTGEEIIDLGVPKKGQPLQGLCAMGMYSFQIQFN